MIIKIEQPTAAFYPVMWYLLEKERAAEPRIIGGVMSATTARTIAQEFEEVSTLRPDIQKPVWRAIVAWHPDEQPTDDLMTEVSEKILDRLGVNRLMIPYIVIRHSEQGHQHAHIVLNRVGFDGHVFLNQRSAQKAQEIRRELEHSYGFIPAQRGQPPPDMPEHLPEYHARKRGEKLYKHRVHEELSAAIAASDGTFSSFDAYLRDRQIVFPEWNFAAATGRFNGGRFALMDPDNPNAVLTMEPSGEPAVFKGAQVGWAAQKIIAGLQERLEARYAAHGVPSPGPSPSTEPPHPGVQEGGGWQARPRRRRSALGVLPRTPRGQLLVEWMRPPVLWGSLHFIDWYILHLAYTEQHQQQRDRSHGGAIDL